MTVLDHRKRLPSADRRQQILDVSARLFVERGYEAVTMGEIARALGVSRPTIYSYFTSTEAVLDVLLQERLHDLLGRLEPLLSGARMRPAPGAEPPSLIAAVFRFLLGECDTLALLHSGGGPTFQARRSAFLNDLGARLQLNPALQIRRNPALLLIVTTLLDSLAFRAATDPGVDTEQLVRSLDAFVRGGVGPWLDDPCLDGPPLEE
ncbi:TetR family transcriptional regulator [Deinococcus phoenicis]|uniref:TetR family transcriptional regulator n=1 Tax=Deinococcus phoenicis TaxID=1476583 RepID=A0A016QTS0_9DEIO|nr:TetR/AcrR family transcriptional regulator [Deinococcus phoenicis]EYB69282.1 TetR family transcriptional regulator [Deinococcus phoenicis]